MGAQVKNAEQDGEARGMTSKLTRQIVCVRYQHAITFRRRNLDRSTSKSEERPAFKRAFDAQLAGFNAASGE